MFKEMKIINLEFYNSDFVILNDIDKIFKFCKGYIEKMMKMIYRIRYINNIDICICLYEIFFMVVIKL